MRPVRWARLLVFVCSLSLSASAQWTTTILASGDYGSDSRAYATNGSLQGGVINGTSATLWSGSAGSAINLSPSGYYASRIFAIAGSQQGGSAFIAGYEHAALWSGNAVSFIDLNPSSGPTHTAVISITNTQQGGWAYYPGVGYFAALWSGTAESFTNLNPTGAGSSRVLAMIGGTQGGYVDGHAGVWTGTASSFVDFNPPGASGSSINAMTSSAQGGFATIDGASHAGLWFGAANTFVDLNPAGVIGSNITGMAGNYQVGTVNLPGIEGQAAVWMGSAETYSNLHSFLPPGYDFSFATGASLQGESLQIVGFAGVNNDNGFRMDAVMWTTAIPEPIGYAAIAASASLVCALTHRKRRTPAPETSL